MIISIRFHFITTLLALVFSIQVSAQRTSSCEVDQINPKNNDQSNYYLDRYYSSGREQLVLFSAHGLTVDDNELKSLWRQLEKGLTAHRKNRVALQVRAKIRQSLEKLDREKQLIELIAEEHNLDPFLYIGGEYSVEKSDRFEKRIEVTNFVVRELIKQTELTEEEVSSYILLLTGEDVYPLLDGQLLDGLPRHPTEEQAEMDTTGEALRMCFGIMGSLEFSKKPEALALVEKISAFYRPRPEQKEEYLTVKDQIIESLKNDALLRLRSGIMEKKNIRKAISSCDSLFDLKRDQTVAKKMALLPKGRGLITRGIGHRYLLRRTFLETCE
jgi:hypothetical protein